MPGLSCGVWSPLSPGLGQAGGPVLLGLYVSSPSTTVQISFCFNSWHQHCQGSHGGWWGCAPLLCPTRAEKNKHHSHSCSCCEQNPCNSLVALQELRSGQHPVSTWIHGNIPWQEGGGSFSGHASHWGGRSSLQGPAETLCWSWAIPSDSAKPAPPLQPPNQDLGGKKPFPRSPNPPSPRLTLTRAGISL